MAGGKQIPVSEFKAHCLSLLDDVRAGKRAGFVITKRGQPLAVVSPPPPPAERRPTLGQWRGEIELHGDLDGIDWSEDFEATRSARK